MSYAMIEETAIDSAEPVDTMAMKSMMAIMSEPGVPKRCVATAGGTRPEPASAAVMGSWSARPPSMYPLYAASGLAAMPLCQYAWSTNTVPKLPMMLMMPNMRPPPETIVRYDFDALLSEPPHA